MRALFKSLVALQVRLDAAGIPSAVIGGIPVGIWGEPRVTRDVDVKILLTRDDAARLLDILGSDYRSLIENPLRSLAKTGVLFVQDEQETRLDLLLGETSFDVATIRRALPVTLAPGLEAQVCTPEDLIIYKLVSTRQRDYEDAVSVIRRQGEALDDDYVVEWLRQFEQALADSTLVAAYQRLRGEV